MPARDFCRDDPMAALPNSFDRELESERARWLRRRFLAFCALWALVAGFTALLSLLAFNDEGQSAALTAWDMATTLASVAMAVAAGVYAWRARVRPWSP